MSVFFLLISYQRRYQHENRTCLYSKFFTSEFTINICETDKKTKEKPMIWKSYIQSFFSLIYRRLRDESAIIDVDRDALI